VPAQALSQGVPVDAEEPGGSELVPARDIEGEAEQRELDPRHHAPVQAPWSARADVADERGQGAGDERLQLAEMTGGVHDLAPQAVLAAEGGRDVRRVLWKLQRG
jgi:hypothetical protein